MTRPNLTQKQLKALGKIVTKFVDDHHISCPESVAQNDEVIENAYDLIESLSEVVGYYEYPDD
jgi:hypothetical protein